MPLLTRSIKVLVWDLDGTLYQNKNIALEMERHIKRFVSHKRDIPLTEVDALFTPRSKNGMTWSQTAAVLCNESEKEILQHIETLLERHKFIKKDSKLLPMFRSLKQFQHILLTNASLHNTHKTLDALGLPTNGLFAKIFALDVIPYPKPSKENFQRILQYTRLSPTEHLNIGDMVNVDIIPAKHFHLQTCMVGYDKHADTCVDRVYDIPKLFSWHRNILTKFYNALH